MSGRRRSRSVFVKKSAKLVKVVDKKGISPNTPSKKHSGREGRDRVPSPNVSLGPTWKRSSLLGGDERGTNRVERKSPNKKRSKSVYYSLKRGIKKGRFLSKFKLFKKRKSKGTNKILENVKKTFKEDDYEGGCGSLKTVKFETLKHIPGVNDLLYYCSSQDIINIRQLLLQGADVNVVDEHSNTALHYCVARSNIIALKELTRHREINADVKNADGDTPLMLAAENGDFTSAKNLLEFAEANRVLKNSSGRTPLEISSNLETINVFIELEERESKFLDAIVKKNVDDVEESSYRLNLNTIRFPNGESVMEYSVKQDNNSEVVEFLLGTRIDISKEILQVALPRYVEILRKGRRLRRREEVIIEMYQSEKTYLDDLRLIDTYFSKAFTELKLRKILKKQEHRDVVSSFYKCFKAIQKSNINFIKSMMEAFAENTDGFCNQKKVISSLFDLNYKCYGLFVKTMVVLEQHMKKKKFREMSKYIKECERGIPEIRRQNFFSLMSKIRFRVMKYKDLCKRMKKYTASSDDIYDSLIKYYKHIEDMIRKMDEEAGEILNKRMLLKISEVLKKVYKWELNLLELKASRHIAHEKNLCGWNLITGEVLNDCELYVLSKRLLIGIRGKKKPEIFHFYLMQVKTVMIFNIDTVRIKIFDLKDKSKKLKMADYMFKMKGSAKWMKLLEKNFEYGKLGDYFRSKFLVISHVNDAIETDDFLSLETAKNKISGKEEQIRLCQMRLEYLEESKLTLLSKIRKFEDERVLLLKKAKKSPTNVLRRKKRRLSGMQSIDLNDKAHKQVVKEHVKTPFPSKIKEKSCQDFPIKNKLLMNLKNNSIKKNEGNEGILMKQIVEEVKEKESQKLTQSGLNKLEPEQLVYSSDTSNIKVNDEEDESNELPTTI